jgi:subtilisin family serine protease
VYTAGRHEQISAATLIPAIKAAAKMRPHLLNLSFSITEGTDRYEVFEREVLGDTLEILKKLSSTAIVASTGNLRTGIEITPMGFPARHEAVIAVGACDYTGLPAIYSRYGGKVGTDRQAWWLAPGGTEEIPLITVRARAYHGTSFAAPLITGLIATSLSKARAPEPDTAVSDALASATARLEIEMSPNAWGHGILLLNILAETSAL